MAVSLNLADRQEIDKNSGSETVNSMNLHYIHILIVAWKENFQEKESEEVHPQENPFLSLKKRKKHFASHLYKIKFTYR